VTGQVQFHSERVVFIATGERITELLA
jgi:hypothetical protein